MYTECYLNEIWKDISGYEGMYQVSNFGRVRSLSYKGGTKTIILSLAYTPDGYLRARLRKNNKTYYCLVHRLVWEAFNGPIPKGMQINHISERKDQNNLENLNLMTPKENTNWGTCIQRRAENQKNKNKSKAVMQYDVDGNFIKEYPSLMAVQREHGYHNQHLSACCNGKVKTAYGYIWKYV